MFIKHPAPFGISHTITLARKINIRLKKDSVHHNISSKGVFTNKSTYSSQIRHANSTCYILTAVQTLRSTAAKHRLLRLGYEFFAHRSYQKSQPTPLDRACVVAVGEEKFFFTRFLFLQIRRAEKYISKHNENETVINLSAIFSCS